jgi:two-component system sensor histidine kinase/response regulator
LFHINDNESKMKLPIGTQLKIGLLLPMLFVIVLGIASYFQSNKHYKKTENLYNNTLVLERSFSRLKTYIISLHRDMKDISIDSTQKEIDIELQWIKWWQLRAKGQIDTIYLKYEGSKNDIDSLRRDYKALNSLCENTITLMRSGKRSEVLSLTKTNGLISEKVEKLLIKLDEISNLTIKKDDKLHLDLVQLGNRFNTKMIILVILIFLFSFIITYILSRNITQRWKTEEALRQSEDKFKYFFDYSAVGKSLTMPTGEIEVNLAFCEMLGYSLSEFKNKKWQEITHPEDIELTQREIDQLLSGKLDATRFIKRFIHKDGTIVWVDLSSSIRRDQNRKPLYLMSSIIDITENIKAEQALKENSAKLIQLNIDKDRFISILGHDLRNPFNNILGFSEVMTESIRNLNTGEIEDIAININKSARIADKLLEEILMWAKMQQGKISFKPQNLSFTDICRETLEILSQAASAKNISVNCLASNQQIVFADSEMLKTVLRNLLSNAIKFTHNGGTININAIHNSDYLTISVSDSGVGIPPENLVKLFDISQVLTTKGTAEETGTGLGLLLCKEFVERHGGKIRVESETGKGSDFIFTMPYRII